MVDPACLRGCMTGTRRRGRPPIELLDITWECTAVLGDTLLIALPSCLKTISRMRAE
jgi:hypothetical protein